MSERELGQGNYFWETPAWGFPNSSNSGGGEDKKGKKPLLPSLNSPTPTPIPTPMLTPKLSTLTVPKQGLNEVVMYNEVGNSGGVTGGGSGVGGSVDGIECKGVGESDDLEVHTWTERERRKKMRNLFTDLQTLMPHLPAKADKSTIIDEAVCYIKTLEHTVKELEKKKLERMSMVASSSLTSNSREAYLANQVSSPNLGMQGTNMPNSLSVPSFPLSFKTWTAPNFVLNVCGDDAQINICVPKKPSLLATLFYVLEKHRVEVITVQVSSDFFRSMFMIHARANAGYGQFQEAFSAEEIFKLVVTEMISRMSS